MNKDLFHLSDDVSAALEMKQPIVAIESSYISHGMQSPQNLSTALAVEKTIRDCQAVPATIAVINGIITVGVQRNHLKTLASGRDIYKAGERDLPFIVAKGLSAGVTVGASLAIASSVGIKVVVAGGIGGVGHGASQTFDISSDLLAIPRYACVTVCSGTKSFMDISATLEFLETHSVPVMVYQSSDFPFFFARNSGYSVDWVVESPDEIAEIFHQNKRLELSRGILIGVPVPEDAAMSEESTRKVTERALEEMRSQGVGGKEYTPKILSFIHQHTNSKSLDADIALFLNNALVGSEIAKSINNLPH
jgi:pseudouridine-5'-phosphate glycosidase